MVGPSAPCYATPRVRSPVTVTMTSDPSGKYVIEVLSTCFGRADAEEVNRAVLGLAAAAGKPHGIVDLVGALDIEDAALAVLISCARRIKALNGRFCLVCCESGSLDSLHISSLDKAITVHARRDIALSS